MKTQEKLALILNLLETVHPAAHYQIGFGFAGGKYQFYLASGGVYRHFPSSLHVCHADFDALPALILAAVHKAVEEWLAGKARKVQSLESDFKEASERYNNFKSEYALVRDSVGQ